MTSIQDAAREMREHFSTKTREDGSQYWAHELADERAIDLARAAHDDANILPDDYRYEYIVDALDILAEYDDDDEYSDALDDATDAYHSELLKWIASSGQRAFYVDDAVKEYGWDEDRGLFQALALGQLAERSEVLYAVKSWLEENAG